MNQRGRPPVTRSRIVTYWEKHQPCTLGQLIRGTGADRRYIQRLKKTGVLNLTACT